MNNLFRPLIKGTNWALAGLLGLLGYSCLDEPMDEYGAPYAEYSIKGKVVNETNVGIPGMQIEIIQHKGESYQYADTIYSRQDGDFTWNKEIISLGKENIDLIVTDIDGEENGSYQSQNTSITFERKEVQNHKVEKEVVIRMEEAKSNE